MQQPDPPRPPGGFERARRMLFTRPGSDGGTAEEAVPGDVKAALERVVSDRMDEAVRAIQQTAASLMHEVAAEVWRTAGGDKREVQAKILEGLSRDQVIRSLIAHSDERFQALTVRTSRLEDTIQRLAEHTYEATESLTRGVHALEEAVGQPALLEVGDLRDRLANVVHQISRALETITERDRIIVEAIGQRVREHGEIVTQETSRIAQAMEAYVQQGVSALGQLAGRVDSQLGEFTGRFDAQIDEMAGRIDERLSVLDVSEGELRDHIRGALEEQVALLGQQLQLLHEQSGLDTREVRGAIEAIDRHAHERMLNLARLVRSDSEAIRDRLVRLTADQDEALARALDERLDRVSQALTSATRWTVEELSRRMHDETSRAIETHAQETSATLGRMNDDQQETIRVRLDDAVSTIDRNMVRMSDNLENQLTRLGVVVGQQAAQAADAAITGKFESTLDRMYSSAAAIERAAADVVHSQRRGEEDLSKLVEGRVASLARMIRSDNQAIAAQLRTEQEAAKQSLRAVKELQANLPEDVLKIVERRIDGIATQFHRDTQETAESIARIADALERRIDEMASRISQRYDNDIQVVVERMGDAMHALGSLGRQRPERIELE